LVFDHETDNFHLVDKVHDKMDTLHSELHSDSSEHGAGMASE
jgi:hypothetical protein